MTAEQPHAGRPKFPVVPTAAWLLLTAGLIVAAARLALPPMGLAEQWPLAMWAALVCAAFGIAGLAPVVVLDRRMAGGAAYGFLLGMLVRLAGCAAVVFIAQTNGAPRAFGYWVGGCYVVLLAVEVMIVGRYVKAHTPPKAGPATEPRNLETDR